MKAISLGWGVQSFTLAAMSALGDLEPVDVAIHADTTHEASKTRASYHYGTRNVMEYAECNIPHFSTGWQAGLQCDANQPSQEPTKKGST